MKNSKYPDELKYTFKDFTNLGKATALLSVSLFGMAGLGAVKIVGKVFTIRKKAGE